MSPIVNTRFLVEPLEPVVFGPPRSFTAAEVRRARSQFPPSPLTFQGLVRSQLLRNVRPELDLDDWSNSAKAERAKLVGDPQTLPEGWKMEGPFPACFNNAVNAAEVFVEPWVRTPRFLLGHRGVALHAREIISTHPGLNDIGSDTLLFGRPDPGALKPVNGWIGPENLWFALACEGKNIWSKDSWRPYLPPFVRFEHQPGLAIDAETTSARFGMLYFIDSLRFDRNSGLMGNLQASLDDRLQPESLGIGAGSVGRKGRLALFRSIERVHPIWDKVMEGQHLPEEVSNNSHFWLINLTPVHLEDPLKPKIRMSYLPDVKIDIRAALTGRPIPVGGYEIATGRPRPVRHYIPEGSAWLIRLSGGTSEDRRNCLFKMHNAHCLGPSEDAAFGFGHTLVGLGPLTTEDAS
jgi:CRISPR/Cas system CMR-associated protein Cmr3 (group 5 of RAMP superfamily)